ncbi:hypothetical protein [Streptomyces sp. NPDC003023]|uniref:hypothetical protein n=1 Tax=Streptomyces sp. NPDC003023 TaxID=3364675 RepID=UPI0036C4466F
MSARSFPLNAGVHITSVCSSLLCVQVRVLIDASSALASGMGAPWFAGDRIVATGAERGLWSIKRVARGGVRLALAVPLYFFPATRG